MNKNMVDYFMNNMLSLDDTFRFKCRGCGKCCKQREDVILNSRDLYNIAKKLKLAPDVVIDKYCHLYIGESSRMPIVRIRPQGAGKVCPFLQDKRCLVHDSKPVICAMYPVGRILSTENPDELLEAGKSFKAGYILNPVDCGSVKKQYTVRSWLEHSGVPTEDEFYLAWNELLLFITPLFSQMEEAGAPENVMGILWNITCSSLYMDYDTAHEFLPQYKKNAEKLTTALKGLWDSLKDSGLMP